MNDQKSFFVNVVAGLSEALGMPSDIIAKSIRNVCASKRVSAFVDTDVVTVRRLLGPQIPAVGAKGETFLISARERLITFAVYAGTKKKAGVTTAIPIISFIHKDDVENVLQGKSQTHPRDYHC